MTDEKCIDCRRVLHPTGVATRTLDQEPLCERCAKERNEKMLRFDDPDEEMRRESAR